MATAIGRSLKQTGQIPHNLEAASALPPGMPTSREAGST